MQEHAFARPDSASARCQFIEVDVTPSVVPLAMTDSMMSSATAAMLAALAMTGATVIVAVCMTVCVNITRAVEVVTVVEDALVVMVLPDS